MKKGATRKCEKICTENKTQMVQAKYTSKECMETKKPGKSRRGRPRTTWKGKMPKILEEKRIL